MKAKILQLNREKFIFRALVGILFICASFYMYFINATVRNTIARQNLENESAQVALSIGNKEFDYITQRAAVTLSLAYSLGFKDVALKTFVSKKSTTLVSYLPR